MRSLFKCVLGVVLVLHLASCSDDSPTEQTESERGDMDVTSDDVQDDTPIQPPACVEFVQAAPPRVQTPSNIRLFFSVQSCDGEPVVGLTTEQFVVSEDEQPISRFESGLGTIGASLGFEIHVVLLLDMSGSVVGAGHFEELRSAALDFVNAIFPTAEDESIPNIHVAIYAFATRTEEIHRIIDFTSCPGDLTTALNALGEDDVPADLATNLYGSVLDAQALLEEQTTPSGDRPIQQGVLVTFTDGTDTAAMESAVDAQNAVALLDRAYTIGVGGEINQSELENLGPSGSVMADDWDEAAAAFTEVAGSILDESRSYYILGYCSPKGSGTHTITVEVSGATGALGPLEFNADDFVPGCNVCEVSNPCGHPTTGECLGESPEHKECGIYDGMNCGTCISAETCHDEVLYCGDDYRCHGDETTPDANEDMGEDVPIVDAREDGVDEDAPSEDVSPIDVSDSNDTSAEVVEDASDVHEHDPHGIVRVDDASIQWPVSPIEGTSRTVLPDLYGMVFEEGVTEPAGAGEGIDAELLVGPDGVSPIDSFELFDCFAMVYEEDSGNDDVYKLESLTRGVGTHDWVVRFRLSGTGTDCDEDEAWLYGGLEGSMDGYEPEQAGSIIIIN